MRVHRLGSSLPALAGGVVLAASVCGFLAPAMAQLRAAADADPALEDPFAQREPMGWGQTPAIRTGEGATELDRLSRSASGLSYSNAGYDPAKDNPLEPVAVVLRGLDKITATYRDLEVPIGEATPFGPLVLLPRTCDKRPPDETPETTVFLEVYASADDVIGQRAAARANDLSEQGQSSAPTPPSQNGNIILPGETPPSAEEALMADTETVFKGWMFASSPSLNAMEHPVYDVWVIDCKMVDPRI